jgi:AraC-like DNA-binding protein
VLWPIPLRGTAAAPLRALRLKRAGIEQVSKGWHSVLRSQLGHHLAFFAFEGRYVVQLDDKRERFGAGHVLIVPGKTLRQIHATSRRGRHQYVHLNEDTPLAGAFSDASMHACIDMARVEHAAMAYVDAAASTLPDAAILAVGYAEILAALLRRETVTGRDRYDLVHRESMDRLWERVSTNPEETWTVERMAAEMHVSSSHFHMLCRRMIGTAPMERVIGLRMDKACALLATTDLPVRRVATLVGYESPYSFSRLFAKHVGCSPGKYRSGSHRRSIQDSSH